VTTSHLDVSAAPRPAVVLEEWASVHGVTPSTALHWVQRGALPGWLSSVGWLIRPQSPPPHADGPVYPLLVVARLNCEERLQLPAVSLREWGHIHGQTGRVALYLVKMRRLPAWRSGSAWLIQPGQVVASQSSQVT